MLKIALKGILARRWRLLTTGIAIVLGIAFISATGVLSQVLSSGANGLIDAAFSGIDVQVRSSEAQESEFSTQPIRPELDESLVEAIRGVDGVARAEGQIQAYASMLDKKGKALPQFGPPTLVFAWIDDPALVGGVVTEGREPQAPGEALLDFKTAEEYGFVVGDEVTVQLAKGPTVFTLVGIGGLGDDGKQSLGSHNLLVVKGQLQELLGLQGKASFISVRAADGVTQAQLAERVRRVLPPKVEAITGEELVAETQENISAIIGQITDFITFFGYAAVFGALFVIYNTFSILIAQRTREMALLRAVGASRSQILGSVVLESAIVGIIASIVGLGAGYGLAMGLQAGLSQLFPFAEGSATLPMSTVQTAFLVGVIATVASAMLPAIRATRIAPVEALAETAADIRPIGTARRVFGVFLVLAGIASVAVGVEELGDPPVLFVGIGAAALFLSVLVIGPLFAGRASGAIGSPLARLYGPTGRLAQQNAVRNPKRTTATASALTIGVGLVVLMTVLVASFQTTITSLLNDQLQADLVVDSGGQVGTGLAPQVREDIGRLDGVAAVASLRVGFGTVLNSKAAKAEQAQPVEDRAAPFRDSTAPVGEEVVAFAIDPATFDEVVDLGSITPSLGALGDDGVMVQKQVADDNGWKVGDTVEFWFSQQQVATGDGRRGLTIESIHAKPFPVFGESPFFVTEKLFEQIQPPFLNVDNVLWVQTDGTVPRSRVRAEIERSIAVVAPVASVSDLRKYVQDQIDPIKQIVNIFYGFLGLTVVVALVGVLNTMLLAIIERTRELGLLRAIGMDRRQVRRSVRLEAAVISLFGTLLGLVLGIALGIALVRGFSDQGIKLDLPVTQLVVIAVLGAVAGAVTALWPSFKAARIDVLQAIATQ